MPDPGSVRLGLELLAFSGRYVETAVFEEWTYADWSLIAMQKELSIIGVRRGSGYYARAMEMLLNDSSMVRSLKYTRYTAENWRAGFENPLGAAEKRLFRL